MPRKESGAQVRKRRAQFEASINESRKFMKEYFTSSGNAERQSADIRRQDESADADIIRELPQLRLALILSFQRLKKAHTK